MKDTLEYKSYRGSVSYSAEDRLLCGRVMGIRDMISFGGKDVKSLERNFRAAVDEYLEFCRVEQKAPDKPFKGSFNVRLRPELHMRAAMFAEERELKLNAVVQQAVEQYLEKAS